MELNKNNNLSTFSKLEFGNIITKRIEMLFKNWEIGYFYAFKLDGNCSDLKTKIEEKEGLVSKLREGGIKGSIGYVGKEGGDGKQFVLYLYKKEIEDYSEEERIIL